MGILADKMELSELLRLSTDKPAAGLWTPDALRPNAPRMAADGLPPTPRGQVRRRGEMRLYQVRAAATLYNGLPIRDELGNAKLFVPERDGTAVHIDMGLGKTIIGLTAIADWFANGVIKRPVLVIAPIKVCETVWRQEAREWAHTRHLTFTVIRGDEKKRAFALKGVMPSHGLVSPTPPTHVYLINPELLTWLQKYIRADWSLFDAMLIDESSMFKDNRAKRFRVLTNYGTKATLMGPDGRSLRDANGETVKIPPHRFLRTGVLTGTPSPSSLMNLWAPLYMIDHGARLHKKFETFQGRFFHKAQKVAEHIHKFDLNAEEDEVRPEYEARSGAPERIHELIADITVELNAEDYGVLPRTLGDLSKADYERANLPPTHPRYQLDPNYSPGHVHHVDLPPDWQKKYKELEKDAVVELTTDTVMAQNGGAKAMMCWQIANGAMYYTDQFGRKEWEFVHDAKIDKLVEVINTLDANCIVTYYFKHDLERIKTRLVKEGVPFAVLKGKTERIIERWNNGEIPVLLLHPQSAGHGLNLQFGGHHIIWYSMLWSLERYLQTNARLARSGQRGVVGIHSIVCRSTLDEAMALNLYANGDDQQRFRSAIRAYQRLRGLGLYEDVPSPQFRGLGI